MCPQNMTGREKCDKLKRIRKALADQMGIDLHQTVCTYEGECRGTCPKCKQEERALNAAIIRKGTAVAGATLVATSLAACAGLPSTLGSPGGNGRGGNGGDDLSGDVAYIEDDNTEGNDIESNNSGGGDDIEMLSGEVDNSIYADGDGRGTDGDCKTDDCADGSDKVIDIPDDALAGDIAPADLAEG